MPLKVVIVEDVPATREALKILISQNPEIIVEKDFGYVDETVEYLMGGAKVDALFLDIRIGQGHAWDILRELRKQSMEIPPVVLVSGEEEKGYAEVVIHEFKDEVVDYYTKPVPQSWHQRQNECVRRIKDRLNYLQANRKHIRRIAVKTANTTEFIPVDEVACFLITNRGLQIYFRDRPTPYIEVYGTIGDYKADMGRDDFVAISRQCLINIAFVGKILYTDSKKPQVEVLHDSVDRVTCSVEGYKRLVKRLRY